jgi:hypothetical protein
MKLLRNTQRTSNNISNAAITLLIQEHEPHQRQHISKPMFAR